MPRVLCQISLPVPASLGAGKYQAWLDATKGEAVWVYQNPDDFGPRVGMDVMLSAGHKIDAPITFLAWVERLLHDAFVLKQSQRLDSVGIHTDRRQEIVDGRVRVQLWSVD
jgi:hypothetical protein